MSDYIYLLHNDKCRSIYGCVKSKIKKEEGEIIKNKTFVCFKAVRVEFQDDERRHQREFSPNLKV
jgi:hypothetical protein